MDDERAGVLDGFPQGGGRVDQAEQVRRLALGDQNRGHCQAGPARRAAGSPDRDRRHQPPAQPAGRVATIRRDGERWLAPDADRFMTAGHTALWPHTTGGVT